MSVRASTTIVLTLLLTNGCGGDRAADPGGGTEAEVGTATVQPTLILYTMAYTDG